MPCLHCKLPLYRDINGRELEIGDLVMVVGGNHCRGYAGYITSWDGSSVIVTLIANPPVSSPCSFELENLEKLRWSPEILGREHFHQFSTESRRRTNES